MLLDDNCVVLSLKSGVIQAFSETHSCQLFISAAAFFFSSEQLHWNLQLITLMKAVEDTCFKRRGKL